MNLFFQRTIFIALISWLIAICIYYLTDFETTLGLDVLFKIRGARPPPSEVVIVAMDDADTQNRLRVKDQYITWRGLQEKLIRELQHQQAALIVFDLHFIESDPKVDKVLASIIKDSGNVLLADCVQRMLPGVKDDFEGRKCSEKLELRQPFIEMQGALEQQVSDQIIAMRTIPPTPLLAAAALEHAPFYLPDNPSKSIYNSWNIYDSLAESPALPLLAWLYYLQPKGELNSIIPPNISYSEWISEQRRAFISGKISKAAINNSKLESRIYAAISENNPFLLDYYGPARSFRMETYLDVYNGQVTDLQGKVVFVGKAKRRAISNKEDTDYFHTPFSDATTGNVSGVEIMATQFANLSTSRFIQPLPYLMVCLVLLAFSCLITLLIANLGWVAGTSVSLVLSGIYFGIAVWSFSSNGSWLPVVIPFMQLIFISLWDLSAWLPFSTAKRNVHGLCLATDIEGYTGIAEGLTPEQLDNLLAPYFKVLSDPVISHAGKVNDITGDAMMAVWFDLSLAKQQLSACLAALEILWAVERFNALSPVCLPIRIGLFDGDIKLRTIHVGRKRFYRAVGNTLNIASRIEGVNKILGTRILAAKSITVNASNVFVRPVGKFVLVGRDEPVELVEILGRRQDFVAAQFKMYQQFSLGLAAFQLGVWQQAISCFESLLVNFGDDGPTKYYLDKALAYQENPPHNWDGTLKLDNK